MEHFKTFTISAVVEMAKHTTDPVEYGKNILTFIGAELSEAIRTELAARIERQRQLVKDAKVLAIGFDG